MYKSSLYISWYHVSTNMAFHALKHAVEQVYPEHKSEDRKIEIKANAPFVVVIRSPFIMKASLAGDM